MSATKLSGDGIAALGTVAISCLDAGDEEAFAVWIRVARLRLAIVGFSVALVDGTFSFGIKSVTFSRFVDGSKTSVCLYDFGALISA